MQGTVSSARWQKKRIMQPAQIDCLVRTDDPLQPAGLPLRLLERVVLYVIARVHAFAVCVCGVR